MKQFQMLINANDKIAHIRPELYGHFSEHLGRCIYQGIYVGEGSPIPNIHGIRKDIVEAFRNIRMPVLRWPGGCFADEYHWRDGIGDKAARKRSINTTWGGVTEDHSFGTHEFMELCELVGCQPYLAGNVGSGTVQELAEWIEYITCAEGSTLADERKKNGRTAPWRLKYLGIGNEAWGCGGNMRPEHYADVYRHYQSFCKSFSGNGLYRIACGPSGDDYHWTETMMQLVSPAHMDGIALHFYCIPCWEHKGFATEFDEDTYYTWIGCANYMEPLLSRHTGIMDRYDPENKIGLVVDEWGTWYDVEPGTNPAFLYQQNTMRDAIVAALTLNIFNRHSGRVVMANLAQAVNVLQSLVLTEGSSMLLTPTYHVFDLYKAHQDGDAVYCFAENDYMGGRAPMLSHSASVKDGVLTLTVANCSLTETADIRCTVCGFDAKRVTARILTDEVHAHNTFGQPDRVQIQPHSASLTGGVLSCTLPPCSVTELTLS